MTDYISIREVYGILENAISPILRSECLPLSEAEGAVTAEAITAPFDAPPFTNAAMDGFAFNRNVLSAGGTITLPVVGTSYAGAPFQGTFPPNGAIRIMTGAPVPEGADTVIQFERTESTDTTVTFEASAIKAGANVRHRGEEFSMGATVIPPGTLLTPAWTGLAASLGRDKVTVRKLRVAVFATGDELSAPGTPPPLPVGHVYNANSATVCALLRHWGAVATDLGILPDNPIAIREALEDALTHCDILVASGGLGEGEHDYTNRVLSDMGCGITHHHVAMRPGKPFSFGRFATTENRYFMALPGNPVAAAVSATLFLRRAMRLATGAMTALELEEVPAQTALPLKARTGRTDLVRGTLSVREGVLTFTPMHSQASGMLTTLAGANAMAVLDEHTDHADAGEVVRCLKF